MYTPLTLVATSSRHVLLFNFAFDLFLQQLFFIKTFNFFHFDNIMADRYSFSLTTFSPSGKLVQIEYALNVVSQGATSVGIKGT